MIVEIIERVFTLHSHFLFRKYILAGINIFKQASAYLIPCYVAKYKYGMKVTTIGKILRTRKCDQRHAVPSVDGSQWGDCAWFAISKERGFEMITVEGYMIITSADKNVLNYC